MTWAVRSLQLLRFVPSQNMACCEIFFGPATVTVYNRSCRYRLSFADASDDLQFSERILPKEQFDTANFVICEFGAPRKSAAFRNRRRNRLRFVCKLTPASNPLTVVTAVATATIADVVFLGLFCYITIFTHGASSPYQLATFARDSIGADQFMEVHAAAAAAAAPAAAAAAAAAALVCCPAAAAVALCLGQRRREEILGSRTVRLRFGSTN